MQVEKYLAKAFGHTGVVDVVCKDEESYWIKDGDFLRKTWGENHPEGIILHGYYVLQIHRSYIIRKLTPVEEELY